MPVPPVPAVNATWPGSTPSSPIAFATAAAKGAKSANCAAAASGPCVFGTEARTSNAAPGLIANAWPTASRTGPAKSCVPGAMLTSGIRPANACVAAMLRTSAGTGAGAKVLRPGKEQETRASIDNGMIQRMALRLPIPRLHSNQRLAMLPLGLKQGAICSISSSAAPLCRTAGKT